MHGDGLRWIARDTFFELGYWITFAEKVEPLELVSRLGCELAAYEPMTWLEGELLEMENEGIQVIRFGTCDGWSFGVGSFGSMTLDSVTAAESASLGTMAISVEKNVNAVKVFTLARNRQTICSFEISNFHTRRGADRDYLLSELMGQGLVLSDGTAPVEHGERIADAEERVLKIAEARFGVYMPTSIKEAGFLTAILAD